MGIRGQRPPPNAIHDTFSSALQYPLLEDTDHDMYSSPILAASVFGRDLVDLRVLTHINLSLVFPKGGTLLVLLR